MQPAMRRTTVPFSVNAISGDVVDAAVEVHRHLGPGLLEKTYQLCLFEELMRRGRKVVREHPVNVVYKGKPIEAALRVDLLVDDTVVVEVKATDGISDVHRAQVLTYLKLGGYPVGLLVNFNEPRLKEGIRRLVSPSLRPAPGI